MVLFLKSISSRRVSNNEEPSEEEKGYYWKSLGDDIIAINSDGDKLDVGKVRCATFTVWRKSLLVSCNGFTVFDKNGNLVYRVDNYICRPDEIVLMNGSGQSILTMRRHKTIKLGDSWLVYDGEGSDENGKKSTKKQQPIWYVKRQVSLLQTNTKQLAHVFEGTKTSKPTYVIEGSYVQRSCKVIEKSSKTIVAEIKRKEAINGCASFGQDVFHLIVWPGFDAAFAMTLVLLLDQMFS